MAIRIYSVREKNQFSIKGDKELKRELRNFTVVSLSILLLCSLLCSDEFE